jgi:signal recognition particle subunit SRP14
MTQKFFTQLTTLLTKTAKSGHGSIYLTQKRLTYNTTSDSDPIPIIIRATNGKSKEHREKGEKVKLSTVVAPDALDGFFVRYADVCKSGMGALKKRDRSKRKKVKKGRGEKKG